MVTQVKLRKSDRREKKFMVTFVPPTGRSKTIYFGDSSASDYTKHKDKERKERYLQRHKEREDWGASGVKTPGWWSRWLLWSEPSMTAAKDVVKRKLPTDFVLI